MASRRDQCSSGASPFIISFCHCRRCQGTPFNSSLCIVASSAPSSLLTKCLRSLSLPSSPRYSSPPSHLPSAFNAGHHRHPRRRTSCCNGGKSLHAPWHSSGKREIALFVPEETKPWNKSFNLQRPYCLGSKGNRCRNRGSK
ncbi:hypothetical protein V8G54_022360 [Vigna mungo]|uniref:Uncharacterized protein n=1 Tax=Vigna mungo TaxID=3915 RepID=A0AAQ3NF20_VIGMU